MSFLSRLFGAKDEPTKSEGKLQDRLERLEAEAAKAAPAFVGSTFNRAGDLALRGGDVERAMGFYGRAIDALLEDGQREAARGVANKIIRVHPNAVRTLCTLTWLDLAAKHTATALLHLRDYVEAAKAAHATSIAADQLHAMARLVKDVEFLGAVADALDGLDYAPRAAEVRDWAVAGGSPHAVSDPQELAAACLRSAMQSNQRSKGEGKRKS